MATRLTAVAKEKGTYVITYTPTDHAGDPVTPSALVWSLLDINDTVINSRDEVKSDLN